MRAVWAGVMAIWAFVGALGLGVSLWLLAATRRTDMAAIEVRHIRRLALARVLSFGFVAVNAPIVYLMFAVPSDGDWSVRVPTGIPFWGIVVAGVIVVIANLGVLLLTLAVVAGIRQRR